jgi:hypothetical protein
MIDRLFTAALAFVILAGGTAAVGTALFERHETPVAVTLPTVEVTAQRVAQTEATAPTVR